MTREEAVAVLEKEVSIIDDDSIEMTVREWDEFDDLKRDAIPVAIEALSVDVVSIHEDGTLEVKVPNAQKVGRVLVMDTDSHIGGGLFYPESADRPTGEWTFEPKDAIELMFTKPKCSECGFESADGGNFCSNCGAKMEGGDSE